MKFISWNVNGLRACVQKGFLDFFSQTDADAFCLQETKLQAGQIDLPLPGYKQFWNYAVKKGRAIDLPVYKFLRGPLVQRFGEEWYKELGSYGRTLVHDLAKRPLQLRLYAPDAGRDDLRQQFLSRH